MAARDVIGSSTGSDPRSVAPPARTVAPVARDAPTASAIVCSVEDADHAAQVIEVADRLARDRGARLVLVQDAPAARGHMYGVKLDPSDEEQHRTREGLTLLGEMARACETENISQRVEFGSPVEVLMRVIEEENADLLVVAGHRRRSFRALVYGRLADKLIDVSRCPVVVVPI